MGQRLLNAVEAGNVASVEEVLKSATRDIINYQDPVSVTSVTFNFPLPIFAYFI